MWGKSILRNGSGGTSPSRLKRKVPYVLSVRGTTEDGDVSYRAHEVLVNAKDEMPSEDEIIKVNQATNATDQDEK